MSHYDIWFGATQIIFEAIFQLATDSILIVNENLSSVYGVIFTIIIGIIFFVYAKNGFERKALIKYTQVNKIIQRSILGFMFSFIYIPVLGNTLNIIIVLYLLAKTSNAFSKIFKFYSSTKSDTDMVDSYLKENIVEHINKFLNLSKENSEVNAQLEKMDNITRFIDDEGQYNFFRSDTEGYVVKIEVGKFKEVGSANTGSDTNIIDVQYKRPHDTDIYIPYYIGIGRKVSVGSILYGVSKESGISKDDIHVYVSADSEKISKVDEYLDPVLRDIYTSAFENITKKNYILVQSDMEKFSEYFDLVFDNSKFELNIISNIDDNYFVPLIDSAVKSNDFDVIKVIYRMVVKYIYKSLNEKSIEKLKIFLSTLNYMFYLITRTNTDGVKKSFYEMYCRSIFELIEYKVYRESRRISKKSKIKEVDSNVEITEVLLASLNATLKHSYQNRDIIAVNEILKMLSSLFSARDFNFEEENDTLSKKRLVFGMLFGFSACVYRDVKNGNHSGTEILNKLIESFSNVHEILEYAQSAYLLEDAERFDWDDLSWDTYNGYGIRSSSSTVGKFLLDFLIDLMFLKLNNRDINIQELTKGIDYELLGVVDSINNLGRNDLILFMGNEESFQDIKRTIVKVFNDIKINYENKKRKEVIEQELNLVKIKEFAHLNFENYAKEIILEKIGLVKKIEATLKDFFGYNVFFYKERFIDKTNLHISDSETFGDGLARSMDNKILLDLQENLKFSEVKTTDLFNLLKNESKNYDFAIIWTKSFVRLEYLSKDNQLGSEFVKSWQVQNSRSYPSGFQGKINQMEIYSVLPFSQNTEQADSVFLFKKSSFTVENYTPLVAEGLSKVIINDDENSLAFCLTNTSLVDEIEKDKILGDNKKMSDDEFRSRVILNFYKGYRFMSVDSDMVKLFRIVN